jgi:hypothetical protein
MVYNIPIPPPDTETDIDYSDGVSFTFNEDVKNFQMDHSDFFTPLVLECPIFCAVG